MASLSNLEIDADRALFDGKLQGVVAVVCENERPLQGLAGLLDWRFQGLFSECIRRGVISGKAGECVYVPATRHDRAFHLILIGRGRVYLPGTRVALPAESLRTLRQNLASLQLKHMGISRADFGGVDDAFLVKQLKGTSLIVVP